MNRFVLLLLSIAVLASSGCASLGDQQMPVPRAAAVDLDRYMGPWFIIAAIPIPVEKGAYDPVETYTRNPDGSIATVFQFRQDSFEGTLETKPIVSMVQPGTNGAEWRVQTLWPLKQQYVISYLDADYSSAIVGRDARDHVWILSRRPHMAPAKVEEYKGKLSSEGYDVSKLVTFPQNGQKPSR